MSESGEKPGGKKKGWNLESPRSLLGAAQWLCKGSDALIVLIVRPGDVVVAVDERMRPADVAGVLRDEFERTYLTLASSGGAKGVSYNRGLRE